MYGAAYSERRKANEDKIALFIVAGRLTLLPFEEADAREAADQADILAWVASGQQLFRTAPPATPLPAASAGRRP